MEDLQRKRNRLLKIIEQGSKLEQLYGQDEFKFFLGWIETVRNGLADKILRGKLMESNAQENHAKGGYDYLTKIIEAAEEFKGKASKARVALKDLDGRIKDYAEQEDIDLDEPR